MEKEEFSKSGDQIHRYENVEPKEFTPVDWDSSNLEEIVEHIEKYIGTPGQVFHELVSTIVHIDVHIVKPSKEFPFYKLITSGMSDKPMNVPKGLEAFQYAELCIFLPENWQIDTSDYILMNKAFEDENSYWPVRWLKTLALFPHEYNTWIGNGHTIPNGEEAAPFAGNTKFGCLILLPSLTFQNGFQKLKINEEKTINFYCLYPLYKEEMDFKLNKGSDALITKFEKNKVTDVVDINRPNTCLKKGLFGLW